MPGRGGKGGRPGGNKLPREVQVSKKLSWLLRHGAEKEGLNLGLGGYVSLNEVLNNRNMKSLKVTMAEVQEIVMDNDKQRFSLIHVSEAPKDTHDEISPLSAPTDVDEKDATQWLIRANQGHSIKVDEEGLMEPLTLSSELPITVVHGTTTKAWPLILSGGGLKKMTRNHVHFASGLPAGFDNLETAVEEEIDIKKAPVISGMRNSSAILIFIDIARALEGGLRFWRSANGVILSEGNKEGIVPIEYFKKVEERRRGLGIIMKDGKLIEEVPPV